MKCNRLTQTVVAVVRVGEFVEYVVDDKVVVFFVVVVVVVVVAVVAVVVIGVVSIVVVVVAGTDAARHRVRVHALVADHGVHAVLEKTATGGTTSRDELVALMRG